MSANKVFFTLDNVREYGDVSPSFDANRFKTYARRCQDINLKELLGPALYLAFIKDLNVSGVPQTQKYVDLLNGKEYELSGDDIKYPGLIPYLSYNWLAYVTREGDNHTANYGNISYNSNPQDFMEKTPYKEKQVVISSFMENTTVYRNDIIRFLNENSATYPEWKSDEGMKPKTSFNIITV